MEVTGALSRCARNAGFSFGADTVWLPCSTCFTRQWIYSGHWARLVSNRKTFSLGKVYSNECFGDLHPAKMGVTVVKTGKPGHFDEAFEQDIKHLWTTVTENLAQRHIKRIIVLDDGGRCVTNIPPDLLSRYPLRVSNRLRWACSCSKKTRLRLPCSHGPGPQSNFKSAGTFFRIA